MTRKQLSHSLSHSFLAGVLMLTLFVPQISSAASFQQMYETLENMQKIVAEYTTPTGEVLGVSSIILTVEAETGQLTGKIEVVNNEYLRPKKIKQGQADYEITIPEDGTYQIEFKTRAKKRTAGKLRFEVDGKNDKILDMYDESTRGDFVWNTGEDQVYVADLKAGTQTFTIYGHDKNLRIDAFRIVSEDTTETATQDDTNDSSDQDENNGDSSVSGTNEEQAQDTRDIDQEARAGLTKEKLLSTRVGFGRNVTGGLNGEDCVVTNLNESGAGSVRECAKSDNQWITFDVSGVIDLGSSALRLGNNTTLDGRGADITFTRSGISISSRENVIVHNIKVEDVKSDAITVYKSTGVWVDHVTASDVADGLLDITHQSSEVTASRNRLENHVKAMLIGSNNSFTEDEIISVTVHDNYFYNTVRRNPLLRFGKVHMFNNVLEDWGESGGGDAVNSVYYGQILLENNVFDAGQNTMATRDTVPNYMEVGGYIDAVGNLALGGADIKEFSPEKVFSAKDYYSYEVAKADQDLYDHVVAYAGWQPLSYFTDGPAELDKEESTDDTSEAVVEAEVEDTETTDEEVAATDGDLSGDTLIIQAEDGAIVAPMVATNEYIYSTETQDGSATYTFTVTESGTFTIELLVKAPTGNSDSVYLTVGSEERETLHLGNTNERDVFVWKESDAYEVDLNKGTVQLVLEGRERNTLIDAIRITADTGSLGSAVEDETETDGLTKKVRSTDNVNVRLTPGGTELGIQTLGSTGETQFALVTTGDYQWTYINFDTGVDGFVATDFISEVATNSNNGMTPEEINMQIQTLETLIADSLEQLLVLQALQS
jgi:pectate lyase